MRYVEALEHLENQVLAKQTYQVITANPIMVMKALAEPAYMDIMKKADLIVPDGTGIIWASRYCRQPLVERVTGFDLMQDLLKKADQHGWRVFLVGAEKNVLTEAGKTIQHRFPNLNLVGMQDGYFKKEEDMQVIDKIRETKPHLLFVARSADTQEPWIAKYKSHFDQALVMGVGGSFDVLAGKVKRAPLWIQRLRLEWAYRLMLEPTRYKRMGALPKFMFRVLKEKGKIEHY